MGKKGQEEDVFWCKGCKGFSLSGDCWKMQRSGGWWKWIGGEDSQKDLDKKKEENWRTGIKDMKTWSTLAFCLEEMKESRINPWLFGSRAKWTVPSNWPSFLSFYNVTRYQARHLGFSFSFSCKSNPWITSQVFVFDWCKQWWLLFLCVSKEPHDWSFQLSAFWCFFCFFISWPNTATHHFSPTKNLDHQLAISISRQMSAMTSARIFGEKSNGARQ